MPRSTETPAAFTQELNALVKRLVASAKEQGRNEALAQMRAVVVGASARRDPGRPRGSKRKLKAAAKPARRASGKKRRNPWDGLSPEARLERVNAIRKGRGLPVKEKL